MCEYLEQILTIANIHLVEAVEFAWLVSYTCQIVSAHQRSALYYLYLGHSVRMSAGQC